MKKNERKVLGTDEKKRKYLNMVFSIYKRREQVNFSTDKTYFSSTEIRLIGEILSAAYEGRRLISTRLADLLGVTRSAISQLVNKLEKEGVVKRVPDAVDRKIAYIEVTEDILEKYGTDLELCVDFVGGIVEKFGEEKFEKMYELFNEFTDLVQNEKRATAQKNK